MTIILTKCKDKECDFELEQMITPLQMRKDSSFYNKDKSDYSILHEKNKRNKTMIQQN